MNTHRLVQRRLRTLLTALGIGLIPVVCGVLVMIHQVDRTLDIQARSTAARTLYTLDRVFDMLRDTSTHIVYAPSYGCSGLAARLRTQVNADPLLRSLRIYGADDSSCGSSEQEPVALEILGGLAGSGVTLLSESAVEASKALLSFIWQDDDHLLQAVVYGEPLLNHFARLSEGEIIQVEFSDHSVWISESGYAHQHTQVVFNRVSKTSPHYDYKVHASYSPGTFGRQVWQYSVRSLPSFVLVGALTSAGVYLGMLGRRRRRTRAAS